MSAPVKPQDLTDEMILEIENAAESSPSLRWECQIARKDPRLKQRANKTAARVAFARARICDAINARAGEEG